MRKFIPRFLFVSLWFSLLFGSYSTESLYHETDETDYHNIKFYIYRYGTNFHDDENEPYQLKFYSDLGIHKTGEATSTGAPNWVRVIRNHMDIIRVAIPEGASEGFSSKSKGKAIKVVLLDENEQPIAGEPTYYHVTDDDGTEYRLHAKAGKTHSLGFPIYKITPEGEKHFFKDSGFEVLFDEKGHFKQFRDLSHIIFISYPDGKTRVMDKYSRHQIQPEKQNGYYVAKAGAKPLKSTRLYHPEPDHLRYMVHEIYIEGKLKSTTTWTRGDNPYVFRLQTKKEGQEILEKDDHYFDDEEGIRRLNRNRYSHQGNHQLQRRSFYTRDTGWRPRYERRVDNGEETIKAFKYIEDLSSGKWVSYPTIHMSKDGKWFRKEYDEEGRVTMEWHPVQKVIEKEVADPEIQALIALFPDPSEESIQKHQTFQYIPEGVPEDLTLAETSGVVEYFGYDSLSPDDKVTFEDTRPRFLFKLEQGKLVHRKWRIYGSRENGNAYFLEEESDDPKAAFGNENNRQTLTEYFGESHAVAPGKKSTVSYADGSMEVYYYDLGTWHPERKNFEVNTEGKQLRTEITHGKLIDGVWGPGTTSRTLIENQTGNPLFNRTRELLADGSWRTLEEL
ncbi:hypothetical protein P0Y35_08125 [Kiritimatiellaeota bacterium B1221]|nr:hypothetical protein [Kiritimatiellaeota bacterium B1221]